VKNCRYKRKEFMQMTKAVKESINVLLGFELDHIGINAVCADALMDMGGMFENGFGAMGHFAVKTNSIDRAGYYLEKRGYSVDWNTSKGSETKTVSAYLKKAFDGFAVHLLQK